jgi:hypothetical protein
MPASYDKCVNDAKRKRRVKNAYAYCSQILKRHARKSKRR